jgi:hypothetical protein
MRSSGRTIRRENERLRVPISIRYVCLLLRTLDSLVVRLATGVRAQNASRLLPEAERDWQWIDICLAPPAAFVPLPVQLAMMNPAKGYGELV